MGSSVEWGGGAVQRWQAAHRVPAKTGVGAERVRANILMGRRGRGGWRIIEKHSV